MKLKILLIGTALLSVIGTGLAYAEHEGKGHGNMLKEADANNDARVSHDEFKAQHEKHMEEMFKKLDANADGFIDEAEQKAGHDKMREKMKEMRKNHQGNKGDMPPPAK